MYKPQFFTFIFALYYVSVAVTLFRVRSTWYAVHGPHHFWGAPVANSHYLPTKFGIKVVTATYYSSDCKNSLHYRRSPDQPYKLLYQLMSSAWLFRKIWYIYLHQVRSYWHFFLISHNLIIQDGGSRHLVFWGCEFDHTGTLTVWNLRSVPNLVQITVIVTEIDALMLKTFIWWRHGN